jgi:hypothetical protein
MLQNCSVKYWSLPVVSKISKSAFGHEMLISNENRQCRLVDRYANSKSNLQLKFLPICSNEEAKTFCRMPKKSYEQLSSFSPTGISENTRKQCMIKNNASLFISARRVYWQPKLVFSHIILLLFSLLDILVSVSSYKLNTLLSVFIYYVKCGKAPKYDDGRKYF